MKRVVICLCFAGALLLSATNVNAADDTAYDSWLSELVDLRLGLLLDIRAARTDKARNWLDGGLGKARYGGTGESVDEVIRLNQASVFLSAETPQDIFGYLQLNVDGEPARRSRGPRVQIAEAVLGYRFILNRYFLLTAKGGMFHAPISLEHKGPAWTPKYTLTPSAINSWLGEELRTIGGQLSLDYSHLSQKASLFGGLFQSNDLSGSMLAWRGWVLSDRQSGLTQRLPLAPIPSISDDGVFDRQAESVDPFREIDDRIGVYTGISLADFRYAELRATYYDNRANPGAFTGSQYAWHTTFSSFGLRAPVGKRFEFLSQYLIGGTRMGITPAGDIGLNNDFYSFYFMGSHKLGRHRTSIRFDRFRVEDKDIFQEQDNNNEIGYAWTLAHLWQVVERHRLGVELTYINSDRSVRSEIGLPNEEEEILVQLSYRFVERDLF